MSNLIERKKKGSRLAKAIGIPILSAAVVITVLTVLGIQLSKDMQSQHEAEMKAQVGIVNGQEYPMVIANKLTTTSTVEGITVLFSGSLSTSQSDTLRMGYTAPNGDSYIIKVPVSQIRFHQESSGESSSSFQLSDWISDETLQENIDQNVKGVTVKLSPDEYQELVQ